jgi:DNA-binding NtrC family response regulator
MLTAGSGSEGLRIAKETRLAAVVSDYAMANGDGLDFLKYINQVYPDTTRIMISGHATLEVAKAAINSCGIMRLFQKPCSTVELGVAIREAISEHYRRCPACPIGSRSSEVIQLENSYPGITKVDRDSSGRILLDEGTN